MPKYVGPENMCAIGSIVLLFGTMYGDQQNKYQSQSCLIQFYIFCKNTLDKSIVTFVDLAVNRGFFVVGNVQCEFKFHQTNWI